MIPATIRVSTFVALLTPSWACGDGESTTTQAGTQTETSGSSGSPSTSSGTTASDGSDAGSVTVADATGSSGGVGSSGALDGSSDDGSSTGAIAPGPDFREPGPFTVDTTPGSLSLPGCAMDYDVFTPTGVASPPTAVLAHGFQGNRGSMAGWAAHWASWGVRVVTPDLCHATIIDSDHAQNGDDVFALAQAVGDGPVLYAGYSAGGLAAVLAAAQDPAAVALLGFDMVDSGGLGAAAAAAVAAPAHDIVGEAAMCNSSANGVPVFGAVADATTVRIFEADHCDFQNPGDALCGLCTAPNSEHTPEQIRATILGLSTAAVLLRTGLDASGHNWWFPGGDEYDAMIAAGELAQL